MARGLTFALPLLLTALPGAGAAQLADPTRPPQAVGSPVEPSAVPVVTSGLQSVILRKGGKPAALINGEVVELGGMLGEAQLVKVTEDAVVMRGPQGDETLRLIPSAEKKPAAVKASATAAAAKAARRPAP